MCACNYGVHTSKEEMKGLGTEILWVFFRTSENVAGECQQNFNFKILSVPQTGLRMPVNFMILFDIVANCSSFGGTIPLISKQKRDE